MTSAQPITRATFCVVQDRPRNARGCPLPGYKPRPDPTLSKSVLSWSSTSHSSSGSCLNTTSGFAMNAISPHFSSDFAGFLDDHYSSSSNTPEEVQQCINDMMQSVDASGGSLEPADLLSIMLDNGHHEVATIVIDAILVDKPNETRLISQRAHLEVTFDAPKALRSFSECFQQGGGNASDYLFYGHLLLVEEFDHEAAAQAWSHAAGICKPSERFDILVACASSKLGIGERQGALEHYSEADNLGTLEFDNLQRLAELHSNRGDVATAVATFDRAAAMEPNNARIRQQRGACKDTLENSAGAISDLDAAILLGLDDSLTYTYKSQPAPRPG